MHTLIVALGLIVGGFSAAGAVNAPKALLTAIDLNSCRQIA